MPVQYTASQLRSLLLAIAYSTAIPPLLVSIFTLHKQVILLIVCCKRPVPVQGNIVTGNPNFNFAQNPAGFDGLWFTGDYGLYLGYLSPGLNSGSNSLAAGLTTDITGALRIQNGAIEWDLMKAPG